MKNVFIIDSDNIGGVEKRFSVLFKYLAFKEDLNQPSLFLVNKKLKERIEGYSLISSNNFLDIKYFGADKKYVLFNKLINRLIEFISMFFISQSINHNELNIVYATTRGLKFRFMFKARKSIIIVYAYTISNKSKIFQTYLKLINKGYIIDCLSENIALKFRTEQNIKTENVFVSPNSFIDFTNTENEYDEKKQLVSFVARFDKKKGTELLLEAIKYFSRDRTDVCFQIIGYGPEENRIKKFISDNQLKKNVRVFFSKKPINELKFSKVFLSLQLEENYPSQSLMEAMACSNAIIATDVGLTYLLVDGLNGVRVPVNGLNIYRAILSIIDDEERLKKMCESSRKKVFEKCNVNTYYSYLEKLLG